MKKLCKALALILCTVMLLSTVTVAGDSGVKKVLTLEEAKKLAIENDTQYKQQDSYVKQRQEDYNDMADSYTDHVKGGSVVDKAERRINNQINLDKAYDAVEVELFNKKDFKRKSDYDVTQAYYDVMIAKYALDDAKRAMDLSSKNFEIAKIKLEFGMITKTDLSQAENAHKTAQAKYNTALSDLETEMIALGKEIGIELDISKYDIDMRISMPTISSLDFEKIKEDHIKNSIILFTQKNELDRAKSKKYLVEQEYEDYEESVRKMSEKLVEDFEDLKFEANRDYNNAQYEYDESVKELDITLKTQFAAINTLAETITTLRKSVENQKTTFAHDRIKYENDQLSKIEFEKSESDLKDLENKLMTTIVSLNSQYLTLTQYSYKTEK